MGGPVKQLATQLAKNKRQDLNAQISNFKACAVRHGAILPKNAFTSDLWWIISKTQMVKQASSEAAHVAVVVGVP